MSNVQNLHIALLVECSFLKHVPDMLGQQRSLALKQSGHLGLSQPYGLFPRRIFRFIKNNREFFLNIFYGLTKIIMRDNDAQCFPLPYSCSNVRQSTLILSKTMIHSIYSNIWTFPSLHKVYAFQVFHQFYSCNNGQRSIRISKKTKPHIIHSNI